MASSGNAWYAPQLNKLHCGGAGWFIIIDVACMLIAVTPNSTKCSHNRVGLGGGGTELSRRSPRGTSGCSMRGGLPSGAGKPANGSFAIRQSLTKPQREPIELRRKIRIEHTDIRLDAQTPARAGAVGDESYGL